MSTVRVLAHLKLIPLYAAFIVFIPFTSSAQTIVTMDNLSELCPSGGCCDAIDNSDPLGGVDAGAHAFVVRFKDAKKQVFRLSNRTQGKVSKNLTKKFNAVSNQVDAEVFELWNQTWNGEMTRYAVECTDQKFECIPSDSNQTRTQIMTGAKSLVKDTSFAKRVDKRLRKRHGRKISARTNRTFKDLRRTPQKIELQLVEVRDGEICTAPTPESEEPKEEPKQEPKVPEVPQEQPDSNNPVVPSPEEPVEPMPEVPPVAEDPAPEKPEIPSPNPTPTPQSPVVTPTPQVPADPTPTPRVPVDPTPTPQVPADPTPTPRVPVDPTPTPQVPADPTPTPRVPVDPTPTPQVPADPTPTPRVPVDPTPTPQVPADPTPTPRVPVDPTPTPRVPADPTPTPRVPGDITPPAPEPTPTRVPGDITPPAPEPTPTRVPGDITPPAPEPTPTRVPGDITPPAPEPTPTRVPGDITPPAPEPTPTRVPGDITPPAPEPTPTRVPGDITPPAPEPTPTRVPGDITPPAPEPTPTRVPGDITPPAPEPTPTRVPGDITPPAPEPTPTRVPGDITPPAPEPTPTRVPGDITPPAPEPTPTPPRDTPPSDEVPLPTDPVPTPTPYGLDEWVQDFDKILREFWESSFNDLSESLPQGSIPYQHSSGQVIEVPVEIVSVSDPSLNLELVSDDSIILPGEQFGAVYQGSRVIMQTPSESGRNIIVNLMLPPNMVPFNLLVAGICEQDQIGIMRTGGQLTMHLASEFGASSDDCGPTLLNFSSLSASGVDMITFIATDLQFPYQIITDLQFPYNLGALVIDDIVLAPREAFTLVDDTPPAGGDPEVPMIDSDGDGVPDSEDNCPALPNPEQDSTLPETAGSRCIEF